MSLPTNSQVQADGLLLSLYHKIAASMPVKSAPTVQVPSGPRASASKPDNRQPRRFAASDHYEPRDRSRDRARYDDRGDLQDGNYGFDEKMEVDHGASVGRGGGGLYSDRMVGGRSFDDRARPRGGNNRDNARGGADRGGRGYC